ncbi:hypothetical protein [Desulfitibacter alkalitolerans]|nr:hypothetical protein [Desulfitibacter alkalitolerans]
MKKVRHSACSTCKLLRYLPEGSECPLVDSSNSIKLMVNCQR